jgi:hypothetical protein
MSAMTPQTASEWLLMMLWLGMPMDLRMQAENSMSRWMENVRR